MTDQIAFESRLGDAFERYLAAAPTSVDATSIAAEVASWRPAAHTWWGGLAWSRPRLRVLVVGLILAALIATAAFAGARLLQRALVHAGPGRLLVVAGATDTSCGPVDLRAHPNVTASEVINCHGWMLSPDGRYLVSHWTGVSPLTHDPYVVGTTALIRDVASGFERRIAAPVGQILGYVRLSPRSTWVAWSTCDLRDRQRARCLGYIDMVHGTAPRAIPGSPKGLADPDWNSDESRVALSTTSGMVIADGDGTDPVPAAAPSIYGWSPDGSSYLAVETRESMFRILLVPAVGGAARPLSEFRPGEVRQLAWLPDGSALLVRTSEPTHDSILDIASGVFRPIDAPFFGPHTWSPNGTRLAYDLKVSGIDQRLESQCLIEAVDGSERVLIDDCRAPMWSLDGSELAVTTNDGGIDIFDAHGSARRQLVEPFHIDDLDVAQPRWFP